MESVAKKITDMLIYNHIADGKDKTILAFGVESFIYKMLHLSVMILIGILFGRIFDIIVFHLFYQKLRTYAGGHHAKSNIVCFMCSCGIAVGTLTFWSLCPMVYKILCTIIFLSVSIPVIWIMSPVEATNKPLDEAETRVYRKKARALLLVETIIIVALYFAGFGDMALVGATALFTLSIMVMFGRIQNAFSIVSKYTR